MRLLLVAFVLVACSSTLLVCPAAADPATTMPVHNLTPTPAPDNSSDKTPGMFDPYLGQGDLRSKAIPACCCSFGFCEEVPDGTICYNNNPICRCSAWQCVHI